MRKSIVAMLVVIAGLLAWNSANAGEVLWSHTDNTTRYIPPAAEGQVTTGAWFPLINSVYSGERGAKGQDYMFDSLYVVIKAGPALQLSLDDTTDFIVWLKTSNDKSSICSDSVLLGTIAASKFTAGSGTYKYFGAGVSRASGRLGGFLGTGAPLARYGRLTYARAAAATAAAGNYGGDPVAIKESIIYAVGTSR